MKNIKKDINFAESVLGFASNDERKEYLRQQIGWCNNVLNNDGPARSDAKSNYGKDWRKRIQEDKKRFENELKNFSSSENDTNFIDIISMDLNVGDVRIYRGKEKKIKNITHTPTRYGLNTKVIYEDNSTEEFYPNQKVKVKIPNGISRFNFLRTNYDNDQFSENELKNFSTPVEDRDYRDALDAIEKAKTESLAGAVFEHTPEKYKDYVWEKKIKSLDPEVVKRSGAILRSHELDKGKQIPIPPYGCYVGSFAGNKCRLKAAPASKNEVILFIGKNSNPATSQELRTTYEDHWGEKIPVDKFKQAKDDARDYDINVRGSNQRLNNFIKARMELNKYQKPMKVNSREDFIKLAREIADKLHQYNKQGL